MQSHRHDFHIFLLVVAGSVEMELDFETYKLKPPYLLYIHPSQVHRVAKVKQATLYLMAMDTAHLQPAYLQLLEQSVMPAKPLVLSKTGIQPYIQAMEMCLTVYNSPPKKLHDAILQNYCNAFAGMVISAYMETNAAKSNATRFDVITMDFKWQLEQHFTTLKRPADYADLLNISSAYLNECVKQATGNPVSWHIQQRVVLEAKRLLYHTTRSVKEIAGELGFEDYAYFSRTFSKLTGVTALSFRKKNHD